MNDAGIIELQDQVQSFGWIVSDPEKTFVLPPESAVLIVKM